METLIIGGIIAVVVIVALFLVMRNRSGIQQVDPTPLLPNANINTSEIRSLVAAGKEIEAIKLVREQTGMGLKEAKDYVEALPKRATPAPGISANVISAFDTALSSTSGSTQNNPATDPDIAALVAAGRKIEAIKIVRERTGLGLKEAKDYVESLHAGQPLSAVQNISQNVPSGDVAAEALAIARSGNVISAIKLVRERTGMGLKEAKDYVEALLEGNLPLPTASPASAQSAYGDPTNDPEFTQLLAAGNKIAAIKRVRKITNMSLKEAKDYVDARS